VEETKQAAPDEATFANALIHVIKGLKGEYPLLFGIGAGIVLVAVLGATGNIAALAIVAAVLVVSLLVWLVWRSRKQQQKWRTKVTKSELTRSPVATSQGPLPPGDRETTVKGVKATDSPIGTHSQGPSEG
jgi:ABC-type nickel/cobalt efflux system permease component RcnA